MKRYDLIDTSYSGRCEMEMVEDPQGEWVKYEDIRGIIQWYIEEATEKAFECPRCGGRKTIDLDKYGLWSPGDPACFGDCNICNGNGFVVGKIKKEGHYE